MLFGKKQDRKIAGDDPNPFSLYFLILCLVAFLFSLLCAVWHSKRVSPHRTSAPRASDLEIYFYVFPYCVPASLFIFFTSCRLAKNKSQNRRRRSKSIFFVFSYFVPASLFIFFIIVPFGIPNESLQIAPPPHAVRATLRYISMYFLIVCRLVFLSSLLCAVWLSK